MDIPYIYIRRDDWINTHAYRKLDSRNWFSVKELELEFPE